MVFMIPAEFWMPEWEVAALTLVVERVVFEKVKGIGKMKPLFIRGHLDGRPVGRMMVDCGASMNIMPLPVFKQLGHTDADLKCTNLSLSGSSGEPAEAQGIISNELTIGSKTTPTTFLLVDVSGRYNVLLGRVLINVNKCVPSTLHQCLIQWVGNHIETMDADGEACMAVIASQIDVQGGRIGCLTGWDITDYDYMIVSRDMFILISIKSTTSVTRLTSDVI
jgi:hypothetical protein